MTEQYKPYEEYDNDDPEMAITRAPENSIAVMGGELLSQFTGGFDQTAELAMLPERITFDKSTGFWEAESLGGGLGEIEGQLIAAVTIWARWTDRVGQPECIDVGKACSNLPHEMGMRIIFDDGVMGLFYWDAFGVAFKAAQGAVRRSKVTGGHLRFDGRKSINTKFGSLWIPTLEKVNEG